MGVGAYLGVQSNNRPKSMEEKMKKMENDNR